MSDIETLSKQVENDRSRLASSLDALTETAKPESLARDVTTAANDIGGALAQNTWNALRSNPAGGLLVTIGLGLLAAGSQRPRAPAQQPTAVDPQDALTGFDARVAQADAAIKSEMTGHLEPQPSASKLKAALNVGLDHLPVAARKRVIKARQAAIVAQESIEQQTRRAARKTKGFVHEQPVTAGALALGFGVLAGSLLPSTRREDALMGARRDALMAEARNALEEEALKAKAKVETTIAEAAGTTQQDLHA